MIATHDIRLVILSVVIAIIAFYTALNLSRRVTVALGRVRTAWLVGGAIARGVVADNQTLVLVSMLLSVVANCAARKTEVVRQLGLYWRLNQSPLQ